MSKIRTRFAPSPTGFLHVGAERTALFAWLVAKQANGEFILRIEDTDKVREVSNAEEHIKKSLNWLGISWDEGPDINGQYKPYKQSERLEIYKKWAQKLVDMGKAYADPYTAEQVQAFRDQAKQNKLPFLYRNHRPSNPPKWDESQPLRFKSNPKSYKWHDIVMGDLSSGPEVIDDFVIMKSDGYPTYNFCHIIDDYLMQISYVIRSQEFISSVPKFLNLYEAFDFTPPLFATLPYVMAIDGKKKLGKRDGARDILDYARAGYLPEAMMNFLATLGWNDGTEQEIFTKQELINKFSLSRVQKSGARFDEKRLLWMNGSWIRSLTIDELYQRSQDFWPKNTNNFDKQYKMQVLAIVQERLKFLAELPELTKSFFCEPNPDVSLITSNNQLRKISIQEIINMLETSQKALKNIQFTDDSINTTLNDLLIKTGQKPNILFSLVRISTTWAPSSPNLADSLRVLGKDKTIFRIKKSINYLSNIAQDKINP